jgi:hypothetical protein
LIVGIAGAAAALIIAVVLIVALVGGGPNLKTYCELADQEDVLDSDSDFSEMISAMKKMKNVAPKDIKADWNDVVAFYQDNQDDFEMLMSDDAGDIDKWGEASERLTKNMEDADIDDKLEKIGEHIDKTCEDGKPK